MTYGDYNGPNKADKGLEDGSCNRTRCQDSPAEWYNHGSFSWYCESCRNEIQFDSFNLRGWNIGFKPSCGHAMFETREMMNLRKGLDSNQIT